MPLGSDAEADDSDDEACTSAGSSGRTDSAGAGSAGSPSLLPSPLLLLPPLLPWSGAATTTGVPPTLGCCAPAPGCHAPLLPRLSMPGAPGPPAASAAGLGAEAAATGGRGAKGATCCVGASACCAPVGARGGYHAASPCCALVGARGGYQAGPGMISHCEMRRRHWH